MLGAGLIIAVVAAAVLRGFSTPSVEVKAALAESRIYEDKVLATGKVETVDPVELAAPFAAKLLSLPVKEGDLVVQGQVLGELDPDESSNRVREAEAALKVAEAELVQARKPAKPGEVAAAEADLRGLESQAESARRNLERYRYLYEQGAVSKSEYESAETEYARAEADLQAAAGRLDALQKADGGTIQVLQARVEQSRVALGNARSTLDKGMLRAPKGGVVLQKTAQAGEYLQQGALILTLGNPGNLEVVAELSEQDIAGVSAGQDVEVQWAGNPGQVIKGKVSCVAPSVTKSSSRDADNIIKVYVTLKESRIELKPGATVDVVIYRVKPRKSLLVPNEAVVEQGGLKAVFVVDGKTARKYTVTTGYSNELYTEIRQGLKKGDRVVLSPGNLKDGQRVQVSTGGRE